ncbi:hypothetical protein SUGI_0108860 [Cryptomeria japonica]|uniref:uncharacterized protein LOC131050587 n=1 Tax=Cryptomeria japonica TaxID=3369 RepID=UPI002408AD8F|nr:uncharacterized protein LOC131050587 [Cryptomeria japonica]GLJ09407.1 hypothetical protein SUGI_0108860 [Cryptomeria japonica]
MAEENLCDSSSSPLRKRARETEEEEKGGEISSKNAEIDVVPEAKRIYSGPAQDADLMALLDRIEKMDEFTEEERVVKNSAEEEMSLKDSSSSNGDVENEFNYNLVLDAADELHMNYFDFCDEDLMAVYSATNYGLLHDYTEITGSLWEDDIWQVKDAASNDLSSQVRHG